MAGVQVRQGKIIAAIDSYNRVLALQPNYIKARYHLAGALMLDGDMDGALAQYKEILQSNAKDYHAINGLGVLLDHASQFSAAQSCYLQGLNYKPRDFAILNNLSRILQISNMFLYCSGFTPFGNNCCKK